MNMTVLPNTQFRRVSFKAKSSEGLTLYDIAMRKYEQDHAGEDLKEKKVKYKNETPDSMIKKNKEKNPEKKVIKEIKYTDETPYSMIEKNKEKKSAGVENKPEKKVIKEEVKEVEDEDELEDEEKDEEKEVKDEKKVKKEGTLTSMFTDIAEIAGGSVVLNKLMTEFPKVTELLNNGRVATYLKEGIEKLAAYESPVIRRFVAPNLQTLLNTSIKVGLLGYIMAIGILTLATITKGGEALNKPLIDKEEE